MILRSLLSFALALLRIQNSTKNATLVFQTECVSQLHHPKAPEGEMILRSLLSFALALLRIQNSTKNATLVFQTECLSQLHHPKTPEGEMILRSLLSFTLALLRIQNQKTSEIYSETNRESKYLTIEMVAG
jgi:hypothetical protein